MNAEDGFSRSLADCKVAIVGLGLMGGSLALALRGHCSQMLGVDHDLPTLQLASQLAIFDQLSQNPAEILLRADLIVLAVPVLKIISYLNSLPALHPSGAVVLDLGSTKKAIINAMQELPDRFDPIGCHPMCGKETSSLANADAVIFQGAPFVLTPMERTSPLARRLALEICSVVGAQPVWIDAEVHDRWVAFTSHLPYLLANALAASIPEEAALLAGSGFRSTARLAGSSIEMMRDILLTNQAPVRRALNQVRDRLNLLSALLESSDPGALEAFLIEGKRQYEFMLGDGKR